MSPKALEYVEKHAFWLESDDAQPELEKELDDLWYSMSPEEIEWVEKNASNLRNT